ncbi:LysR family transcriptional regulator [Salipiger sp.]|uniref:LysR family transcriptional regulator n=1 Tax=Salipiger sp. TaxID=2078585 RepID=UPI003A96E0B5
MDLSRRLKPSHLMLIDEIAKKQKLQLAAEALSISQPAASRMLADIEANMGTPLFVRHPRWMELTQAGEAVLRHVRVVLWELETLEAEVEHIAGGRAGVVRVGAVTGPAVGCLMPALRKVKGESPDIETTIEVGPSVQLVRRLQEGRLDFIIARLTPEQDSSAFHVYPARSERVTLLVRDTHPLAGRPDLPLEAVAGYEWVMQERGSPIRQAVERAFLEAGTPVPANVSNSSSLLIVLSIISQADVISPQSKEVADILTGSALGARLVALEMACDMTVSPYFVLSNRSQQLSRASERVLKEVLKRL